MKCSLALAGAVLLPLAATAQQTASYSMPELPPNARPGECYARTFLPPVFRTDTTQVLKSPATERIEIIPAEYGWAEEKVLLKPEGEKIVEVIPAEYRWVEDRVLTRPESERIEEVPATYKTVEERELVKPATTQWKQGRGLTEKVDNATGEIMCLVEVPAEYRTVTKKVLDQPASTRRIVIPAEYTTVRRQELVKPAEVRKAIVPAEYQVVKTRKLLRPAQEQRIPVPAEYQTLNKQVLVSEGRMEWRQVLCETNATPDVVRNLQEALQSAGYNPGKLDGRLGWETQQAVKSYQKANGLAEGGVTLETLTRLGVSPSTGG